MRARLKLGLLSLLALPSTAIAVPTSVVQTESGAVQGDTANGIDAWKGIPFAQPPVGQLRWRAPRPASTWSGVRNTADYGHDCMQVPFPSDAAPLGTPPAEDCLYLNVWRPHGGSAKLPVIVWVYGGGFVNGGASPPTYSGAELARQGVMVVSFNYRLGRFGTFAHPALTQSDPDHGLLGNYGFLDQIAALNWVRQNVAAFGGDPANVTLVGESAGGMSVLTLLTSPLSRGLFAKAVVMSGGGGQPIEPADLKLVEKIGADFMASKGIDANDPAALSKMRELSADQVTNGLNMMALFNGEQPRTFASPYVDGRIAVDTVAAIKAGAFNRVPVMIGATSGDIGGDTGFMIGGARNLAKLLTKAGVPVYEYRFSYVADALRGPSNPKATHASDIPFFFDTQAIKYGAATTAKDDGMGRTISGYIVDFAKAGDPNGEGRPEWARYNGKSDNLVDFSADGLAKPVKDPLGAAIDAAPATSSTVVLPKLPSPR